PASSGAKPAQAAKPPKPTKRTIRPQRRGPPKFVSTRLPGSSSERSSLAPCSALCFLNQPMSTLTLGCDLQRRCRARHFARTGSRLARRLQLLLAQRLQHFVAWTVHCHHTVTQHQQLVDRIQHIHAVRDQDHGRTALLETLNPFYQCRLAYVVEIRI